MNAEGINTLRQWWEERQNQLPEAQRFEGVGRWQVEDVPIGDLRLSAKEHHILSEYEFGLLCASIAEDGFTKPILINEANDVVHGRWRYRAARVLGLATVPALRLPVDVISGYMTARRHNTVRGDQDTVAEGSILQQLTEAGHGAEVSAAFNFTPYELDTLIRQLSGSGEDPDLPDLGNLDDLGDLGDLDEIVFLAESEPFLEITYQGLDAAIVREVLGDDPKAVLLALCEDQ